MTIEQIERFITENKADLSVEPSKISFKTRNTVEGIFIKGSDYLELKKKNFWRVVSAKNLDDYRKSKDSNLSRIFNGSEFTRLSQK